MNERCFEIWLIGQGYKENTINSRMSNCKRVEKYEGNLNDHYNEDELKGLEEQLSYSKIDERNGKPPRHEVLINGNICKGTATLKQAVKLYSKFKVSGDSEVINTQKAQKKRSLSRSQIITKWPKWQQPTEENILKLAEILAPFVRFLNPEIIYKITEDNYKHQDEWSRKLKECDVDPGIYLWDNSPCAFPGVRRYSGRERNDWRKLRYLYPDCFCIDDNSFPKHLWAFVFTGCEFRNHGPKSYQLAHIFDHKTYKNRWQREMKGWRRDIKKPPKLFGLFTSPANTAYVPTDFLKPTDFSHKLRILLQRKAFELYGDVCQILPPPLEKSYDDQNWDLEKFDFGTCVGDITHVSAFLKFRNQKMDELFDKKFHSK